ncbi:histidinol phosphate aminotransferase apoenzyme [Pyrobaculum islandicum DSM 4184]|uniref:histidinol-phosphate transaminase n=1 Tax=Pyrobaculum islandicum (strain DSM 4184 / JCM 9189 / GEO3) TaxID=384616 RepID=A1RTQ4_PYRIL|nr:histidinol-phosphate transaminase [Pyrobaculum islandicum]ABL88336.1 histidinol phosphate aminotransferase apoenzyme [Pyrobaculum islandicum DSM 4184]
MLPPPAGVLKLDQNEVPIQPPDYVVEAASYMSRFVNWYPPRELYDEVKTLYAEYAGVKPEYVVLFPGVDGFFELFLRGVKKLVAPAPCFYKFEEYARSLGVEILGASIAGRFRLELSEFLDLAKRADAIYIDSPNDPSGQLLISPRDLEEVLALGKPTVVDEAFFEFSGVSIVDLVESWPNLAVVRTMSKAFLLAGFRITPVVFGRQFKLHDGLWISLPSLAAARAALYKRDYVDDVVKTVKGEAQFLFGELQRLGFDVLPTYANFILAKGPPGLARGLRKFGVWVRDEEERLGPGYVRITVGTRGMNLQLVRTLALLINS